MNYKFEHETLQQFKVQTLRKIVSQMKYTHVKGLGVCRFTKKQLILVILIGQEKLCDIQRRAKELNIKYHNINKRQLVTLVYNEMKRRDIENQRRLRRNERARLRRYWRAVKKRHNKTRRIMKIIIRGGNVQMIE